MEKTIDLHTHTSASDGTLSPSELISLASDTGLSAVAITDHDTVSGIAEATSEGEKCGIEVVPGIEFSTKYKGMVHLLGFYINPECPELLAELDNIVRDRDERNEKIVEIMRADGIDITYEQMKERFGDVIGRPHIATILVENGIAADTADAFARYVSKGMEYYVPRRTLPIERCFELIQQAGGLAILAHPFEYGYDPSLLDELILYCFSLGAVGLEVRHPSHTKEQMDFLEQQAEKYGFIKTGGSDFHGSIKPNNPLGEPEIPYSWLEHLKIAAAGI